MRYSEKIISQQQDRGQMTFRKKAVSGNCKSEKENRVTEKSDKETMKRGKLSAGGIHQDRDGAASCAMGFADV